jgi:hypothetical protein
MSIVNTKFWEELTAYFPDREGEKESGEVMRNTTLGRGGARNHISSFESSQAMPARPSGRGNE